MTFSTLLVDQGFVLEQYLDGFHAVVARRLELEATAVRGGRFDFVRKVGFGLAVRHAPFPS